jgi:hypothetical protein
VNWWAPRPLAQVHQRFGTDKPGDSLLRPLGRGFSAVRPMSLTLVERIST